MPSLMWSPGSPGPEFDTHASPPYTFPKPHIHRLRTGLVARWSGAARRVWWKPVSRTLVNGPGSRKPNGPPEASPVGFAGVTAVIRV